ncbi:helix-turn-helix domain-containing protein [Flavobacterium sp. N2038]|uniref:helix-turn-helix domain-containing protein n=1 Tax=Flavobacterium sp. N2038 TaxID=2986829 RepID=UPI0022240821|nr:helix-turn-helix transcriptional regulator [Flavobacterium sp. N2038]
MSILKLKELLIEKGITSKELSEKVGVSTTSISQIITEKQQPRFELLIKIAEFLDVDIKDLFNPTKSSETETVFVFRDGIYVPIGELKKE